MLSSSERRRIIDLINREVVPAIGCTEPIAVALCTARAAETLGAEPEKITVRLSANILKNAMGVGIPGTGMIGLPIAVALGALVGRSEYQLEVLRDVTPEAVERGREMIDRRCISIGLKEGICEKLYIEAEGKRSVVHCLEATFSIASLISEVAKQMPGTFLRVHRSYLVNTAHISGMRKFMLELSDGTEIPIPERRYIEVRREIALRATGGLAV